MTQSVYFRNFAICRAVKIQKVIQRYMYNFIHVHVYNKVEISGV